MHITLSALRVAPNCPLLKKCETILLRMDRGSNRKAQKRISLDQAKGMGMNCGSKDALIAVDLKLSLQTWLFSRHEDSCYSEKPAWIKIFAGSIVNGAPVTQLKIDLA